MLLNVLQYSIRNEITNRFPSIQTTSTRREREKEREDSRIERLIKFTYLILVELTSFGIHSVTMSILSYQEEIVMPMRERNQSYRAACTSRIL